MRYRSTASKAPLTSLRGAVLRGLAPDGGLYMPAEIARHTPEGVAWRDLALQQGVKAALAERDGPFGDYGARKK